MKEKTFFSIRSVYVPWQQPWLWLMVVITAVIMSILPVASYRGYNLQSFDLGNMSQAIWSVTQGLPLVFTTEGMDWSRLGYHVELFYLFVVPFYVLWPTPETLLIFESVLFSIAAFPLYQMAQRHLAHSKAALMLTAVYLLYPVAQTAVLFQFHGDTLAMPLLIFALEALDRGAWRSYGFWLLLALSCKFYVAVPVAVLGIVLWWRGQRWPGLVTIGLAASWLLLVFLLIRPLFAPTEPIQVVATTTDYLSYYFLDQIDSIRHTASLRAANGLIAFAPIVLLAWRAPLWLLPAVAITLPIVLSSGPGPSYDYRYHHYALAVPFLITAAIYGAALMKETERTTNSRSLWYGRVRLTFFLTIVLNAMLVNTPLSPLFYITTPGSGRGFDPSGYGITERDRFKDAWLTQHVPPTAPIMADDRLGSRLTNRRFYYRTQPQFRSAVSLLPRVDYVVVDGLNDFAFGYPDQISAGGVAVEHKTIALLLTDSQFHLQHAQDGLLLFARQPSNLIQTFELRTWSETEVETVVSLAQFDQQIALLSVNIEAIAEYHTRFHYEWLVLQDLTNSPQYFAVTKPDGLLHARILHVPSLASIHTSPWTRGTVVYEVFDVLWSETTPHGRYALHTSWYNSTKLLASQTDNQSHLGEDVFVGWLEIP